VGQRVATVNPAADDLLKDAFAMALKPVAKEWQEMVEEKISVVAQRNFTGQPVTRAEQGLGRGQPPRLVTGDLHANVDSFSEKTDYGARGVVSSYRNEDPSVPVMLEFELGIPYMGPALEEFSSVIVEKLAVELRKILK
jgi:hypothetical protein